MRIDTDDAGAVTVTVDLTVTDGPHLKRTVHPAAVTITGMVLLEGEAVPRPLTYWPDPRPFSSPLWAMLAA